MHIKIHQCSRIYQQQTATLKALEPVVAEAHFKPWCTRQQQRSKKQSELQQQPSLKRCRTSKHKKTSMIRSCVLRVVWMTAASNATRCKPRLREPSSARRACCSGVEYSDVWEDVSSRRVVAKIASARERGCDVVFLKGVHCRVLRCNCI